ncbi:hypothetical protein, partial [Pseudomonas coronafaciens]|uniref:hypothetical protein n=1 Tax=Pseudomonas coronafaciens TaxID=53409 RepID=UPI001967F45A
MGVVKKVYKYTAFLFFFLSVDDKVPPTGFRRRVQGGKYCVVGIRGANIPASMSVNVWFDSIK